MKNNGDSCAAKGEGEKGEDQGGCEGISIAGVFVRSSGACTQPLA